MEKTSSREGKVAKGSNSVAGHFGALAGLASSGPIAAVFLNGWAHEALGEELSRSLDSWVTEGTKGVKYLTAERRRDVRSWFYSGRVAVE
jgi:hypothetical protein